MKALSVVIMIRESDMMEYATKMVVISTPTVSKREHYSFYYFVFIYVDFD